MAIFGTSAPKIVSGATTIELDYAVVQKSEPDERSFVIQNEVTGADTHADRGYHWNIEILINLYKYTDPSGTYNQLVALLGTSVNVYPHRDHAALSDSGGNDVDFLFTEIVPSYVDGVFGNDALLLKFTSLEFVDISQSLS
jgi:hypothetical protein